MDLLSHGNSRSVLWNCVVCLWVTRFCCLRLLGDSSNDISVFLQTPRGPSLLRKEKKHIRILSKSRQLCGSCRSSSWIRRWSPSVDSFALFFRPSLLSSARALSAWIKASSALSAMRWSSSQVSLGRLGNAEALESPLDWSRFFF